MEERAQLDYLKITALAEDSVLYESPYLGQHGISFLLEATIGEECKRILVDVGQNAEALLYNMSVMGISPSTIDALVLTHCHYDHTKGLANMLRQIGGQEIPVFAHPDIYRLHFITEPYHRHVGMMQDDSMSNCETAGGRFCLSRDPVMIMPGVMTTGEVPRRTEFEEVGIALKTIKNGVVKNDDVLDDISLIAHIKERGLIIVTGCSHAGIVNIARHSMDVMACSKIEGIIGGIHLVEASDALINRTVEALSELDISWICAGHCTGFKAQMELCRVFGDGFSPLRTGMKFEIPPDPLNPSKGQF
jgi:7,8-dihydropterin-6-yl-methyl-4-(beta-D-ribofuranosyl)aminobenzene 5'-phosphate synthase